MWSQIKIVISKVIYSKFPSNHEKFYYGGTVPLTIFNQVLNINDVPEDTSALLDPGHVGAVHHEDEPVHLHYHYHHNFIWWMCYVFFVTSLVYNGEGSVVGPDPALFGSPAYVGPWNGWNACCSKF